jgi:F0F1-type ATP synthase gamma subunit
MSLNHSIVLNFLYASRKTNLFFDLLLSNSIVSVPNLYNYNVLLVVLDAFEENRYSELGCRAFSMEMAHRNSITIITENMLLYNKARQAGITNALLEVVSGATYAE